MFVLSQLIDSEYLGAPMQLASWLTNDEIWILIKQLLSMWFYLYRRQREKQRKIEILKCWIKIECVFSAPKNWNIYLVSDPLHANYFVMVSFMVALPVLIFFTNEENRRLDLDTHTNTKQHINSAHPSLE